MKVLVACEESQEVCKAFRARGHEAYSYDILPCSGGHPEWHIQGDALQVINGRCTFQTADGSPHTQADKWDLLIAHPPCTFLTVTGNRWFEVEKYGDKARERYKERYKAIVLFMQFALAECDRIAIENPVGIMGTAWRKSDQIIQPWQFGDAAEKQTALWLKGLEKLRSTNIVEKPERLRFASGKSMPKWYAELWHDKDRATKRSKTFPGIARAMAEQWGGDDIIVMEGWK